MLHAHGGTPVSHVGASTHTCILHTHGGTPVSRVGASMQPRERAMMSGPTAQSTSPLSAPLLTFVTHPQGPPYCMPAGVRSPGCNPLLITLHPTSRREETATGEGYKLNSQQKQHHKTMKGLSWCNACSRGRATRSVTPTRGPTPALQDSKTGFQAHRHINCMRCSALPRCDPRTRHSGTSASFLTGSAHLPC